MKKQRLIAKATTMRREMMRDPRLPWAIGLLCIGLSGASPMAGIRIIPGGPWIHLSNDVIPLLGLVAIGFLLWRQSPAPHRHVLGSGCCAIILALMWGRALLWFISFWCNPYARGDWIGW
jgi:hypothetical protein